MVLVRVEGEHGLASECARPVLYDADRTIAVLHGEGEVPSCMGARMRSYSPTGTRPRCHEALRSAADAAPERANRYLWVIRERLKDRRSGANPPTPGATYHSAIGASASACRATCVQVCSLPKLAFLFMSVHDLAFRPRPKSESSAYHGIDHSCGVAVNPRAYPPPTRRRRPQCRDLSGPCGAMASVSLRGWVDDRRRADARLLPFCSSLERARVLEFGHRTLAAARHARTLGRRTAPFAAAGDTDEPLGIRTAILLTLRNEDPRRAIARLRIVKNSVDATGQGARFAYFILSDTNDPALALAKRSPSVPGGKASTMRTGCITVGATTIQATRPAISGISAIDGAVSTNSCCPSTPTA